MDFTFLTPSGTVAFQRDDAEQAEWTQEELNLVCSFPFDAKKVIERGMVVLFQDTATNNWKAYEIRNCATYAFEQYQQFTAEDIAVAELSDCHIQEETEFTDVTAKSALSDLLSGTGWSVGEDQSSGTSSGDVSRGDVWQAVGVISENWNVYIMPRVTVNADGIRRRYLDILSSDGVWRGVRLAVNKNLNDPCVTYDDTELKTALYGYGASYTDEDTDETEEYNFSGITWSKTSQHPAKPSGQKYLEDPTKTALYGRNGKPRFGYYQTTEIDDPETLLEKTWEVLKTVSDPKISITGTVEDLKRLGYADEPIRLHDMAIVELEPVGQLFYKQIIQCTVDLLDPSKTTVTVGDYIPNIIYINRDTEEDATGGSGSGGGSTNNQKKQGEFETSINWNERNIWLNAKHIDEHGNILEQAGMTIDPITGVLIYAEDNVNMIGSKFKVVSDSISAEVKRATKAEGEIAANLKIESDRISANVKETNRQGDILKQAGLSLDKNGALIYAENNQLNIGSKFKVLSNQITAEVKRAKGAEDTLSGKITVMSNKISLVVTESHGEDVVNAASIVLGINGQTGSYVKIKADTINLSGYATVSELNATNATITNLTNGTTTANKLSCTTLVCGTLTKGSYSYGEAAFYDMNGNIKYCLCRS